MDPINWKELGRNPERVHKAVAFRDHQAEIRRLYLKSIDELKSATMRAEAAPPWVRAQLDLLLRAAWDEVSDRGPDAIPIADSVIAVVANLLQFYMVDSKA